MNGTLDCIPCLVRQSIELSKKAFTDDTMRQKWVQEHLSFLSSVNFLGVTPPEVAAHTFRRLKENYGLDDPYKEEKEIYNRLILSMEGALKERINRSQDPLKEALIMAITGNIIDFATPHGVSEESVLEQIRMSEETPLKRDDSKALFQMLAGCRHLLYIGDNCGEIVFDKLFIETLLSQFPKLEIAFAVRGVPVLNDVTLEDARSTGMEQTVRIISNGDDAPGTRLENVSDEFREFYEKADVIISKGQGNLETLNDAEDKAIFFLFMAKCPVISEKTGAPLKSLMCMEKEKESGPLFS